MNYKIEKKAPYLIMGGKPLSNDSDSVSESEFWKKMKEVVGESAFNTNEDRIKIHLSRPGNFIEFGDFVFIAE